jgi:hypothetical protein
MYWKLDDEVDDESLPYVLGVGCFIPFSSTPAGKEKPLKKKDPIGFIRPTKKDVSKPKATRKDPDKGKRKITPRVPKKRQNNTRTNRSVRTQSRPRAVGFRPAH